MVPCPLRKLIPESPKCEPAVFAEDGTPVLSKRFHSPCSAGWCGAQHFVRDSKPSPGHDVVEQCPGLHLVLDSCDTFTPPTVHRLCSNACAVDSLSVRVNKWAKAASSRVLSEALNLS